MTAGGDMTEAQMLAHQRQVERERHPHGRAPFIAALYPGGVPVSGDVPLRTFSVDYSGGSLADLPDVHDGIIESLEAAGLRFEGASDGVFVPVWTRLADAETKVNELVALLGFDPTDENLSEKQLARYSRRDLRRRVRTLVHRLHRQGRRLQEAKAENERLREACEAWAEICGPPMTMDEVREALLEARPDRAEVEERLRRHTRISFTYTLGGAHLADVVEAIDEGTTDLMRRLDALGVDPVGNVHTEVEDAS